MGSSNYISPFPFLDAWTFWWVFLVTSALFAVAVTIVLVRHRRDERHRHEIAWKRTVDVLDERALGQPERTRLLGIIRREARNDPLDAVTTRRGFDACVEAEMERLLAKGSREEYERAGVELRDARVALGLDYIPFGQRIGSTRELHIGQVLWLARAEESIPEWLQATVTGVDEAYFQVAPSSGSPDRRGGLAPGVALRCRMWREDDARYLFDLTLADVETRPPVWTFAHTSVLQRIQDRAHYRVRVDYAADMDVLNSPLDEQYDGAETWPAVTQFRGRLTNLSAGGFAMVTQQSLPKQVLIRFSMVIPEAGRLTLLAKPVEVVPQSAGRNLVRAYFVGIDDESRDAIARFVLHRQQRLNAESHGGKVALS